MVPRGGLITCMIWGMFPVLDLYYPDAGQLLITAGQDLDSLKSVYPHLSDVSFVHLRLTGLLFLLLLFIFFLSSVPELQRVRPERATIDSRFCCNPSPPPVTTDAEIKHRYI